MLSTDCQETKGVLYKKPHGGQIHLAQPAVPNAATTKRATAALSLVVDRRIAVVGPLEPVALPTPLSCPPS